MKMFLTLLDATNGGGGTVFSNLSNTGYNCCNASCNSGTDRLRPFHHTFT